MKKRRQTMEKFRREQAVKQRRADKLQKKETARIAKASGEGLQSSEVDVGGPSGAS